MLTLSIRSWQLTRSLSYRDRASESNDEELAKLCLFTNLLSLSFSAYSAVCRSSLSCLFWLPCLAGLSYPNSSLTALIDLPASSIILGDTGPAALGRNAILPDVRRITVGWCRRGIEREGLIDREGLEGV